MGKGRGRTFLGPEPHGTPTRTPKTFGQIVDDEMSTWSRYSVNSFKLDSKLPISPENVWHIWARRKTQNTGDAVAKR
jgi:hypothetical protein